MTELDRKPVFTGLFDGDGPALVRSADGEVSRNSILARAHRVAAALADAGLASGDRVAILCRSPVEAIVGFFAVLAAPCAAVPLHPAAPPAALAHVLADSAARAIVTDLDPADLPAVFEGLKVVPTASPGNDTMPTHPPEARAAAELAVILYTSGTTGVPKGVEITVGNLDTAAQILVHEFFRIGRDDVVLLAAPLTNIYGVCITISALHARACLSVLAELRPALLIETLLRDRVTFIGGVPILGSIMLRAAIETGTTLPNLRRVLLAGTALDPALAAEFSAHFGCEVMTGYAMTEAVPLAMATDLADVPQGSVGRVAGDVELQIVGEDMRPAPVGAAGEILVKGPMVSPGYWQAPDLNAAAFHDGWFRTGDIGKLDGDGNLTLIDRLKELIKSAGNTVYPSEVETVLKAHPGIQDTAVVGAPHDSLGELVVAHFIPRAGQKIDVSDLRAWCRDRLVSWKVPRKFVENQTFPVTASGKIAKARLRAGGGVRL